MKPSLYLLMVGVLTGCVADVTDEESLVSEQTSALIRDEIDPPDPTPPVNPDPPIQVQIAFKHTWCFGPRGGYDPREWIVAPTEDTLSEVLHHKFDHTEAHRTERAAPSWAGSRTVTVSSFTSEVDDVVETRPGDFAWARLSNGWYVELGMYWGGVMTRTIPLDFSDPARLEEAGYHIQKDNFGSCGYQHRGFLDAHKGYCPDYPNVPVRDFCSFTCPCDRGEGHCSDSSECGTDLTCRIGSGPSWGLPSGWNACESPCGNRQRNGSEQCDDGGRVSGDGCSASCTIEGGWECPSFTSCRRIRVPPLCRKPGFGRDCDPDYP